MILVQILLNASRNGFQRKTFDLWKNGAIKYMYNFNEIMLYSQYPSENFLLEICVISNNLKIF